MVDCGDLPVRAQGFDRLPALPMSSTPPLWLRRLGFGTIALFPFESYNVFGRSPAFWASVLLVLAVVTETILTNGAMLRSTRFTRSMTGWACAFLVLALMSTFWSLDPHATLVSTSQLLLLMATTVSVSVACVGAFQSAMISYVGGAVVYALVNRPTSELDTNLGIRADYLVGNANDNALVAAIALVMLVSMSLERRAFPNVVRVAASAVLASTLLVTGSRTATAAALVGVGLVLVLRVFTEPGLKAYRVVTIPFLALAAWQVFSLVGGLSDRYRAVNYSDATGELDLTGRSDIWANALQVDIPVFGYGFGIGDLIPRIMFDSSSVLHNDYLAMLLSFGWLGVAVPLAFLLVIAVESIRVPVTRPVVAGLWAVVAMGMAFYPISLRRSLWIVICFALLAVVDWTRTQALGINGERPAAGESGSRRNAGVPLRLPRVESAARHSSGVTGASS